MPDTSICMAPMSKRDDRKLELGCLEISVRSVGPRPVGFGRFPIGVGIYQGGSFSYYTSNYRPPMRKRTRSKTETGHGASGNIIYVRSLQDNGFWRFPIGVSICQGSSVSSDTSNCRAPMANGPDRKRKLEPGCLEI